MSGGGTVITRDSLQRCRPVWERCIEIETNTRYKTLLDRTSSKITAVEDARRRSLRPVDRLHRYIACGLQRVLLWCAVVKEILLLLLLLLMLTMTVNVIISQCRRRSTVTLTRGYCHSVTMTTVLTGTVCRFTSIINIIATRFYYPPPSRQEMGRRCWSAPAKWKKYRCRLNHKIT